MGVPAEMAVRLTGIQPEPPTLLLEVDVPQYQVLEPKEGSPNDPQVLEPLGS
jgi:hypothetical protein